LTLSSSDFISLNRGNFSTERKQELEGGGGGSEGDVVIVALSSLQIFFLRLKPATSTPRHSFYNFTGLASFVKIKISIYLKFIL